MPPVLYHRSWEIACVKSAFRVRACFDFCFIGGGGGGGGGGMLIFLSDSVIVTNCFVTWPFALHTERLHRRQHSPEQGHQNGQRSLRQVRTHATATL